jgi:tRNA pseudouridine55 synthase
MTMNLQTKIVWRDLNGVLLLNKGLGLSSNRALQQVRKLFRAAKAGHTGSLDPLATGVLPICFGEATKFASYLLDSDKIYVVTAQLGVTTTTGDCEGEVGATQDVALDLDQLQQVLQDFIGATQQTPSMYSALKFNGQPLYKLARQGIDIPRASREINISSIELLAHTADTITLKVHCSKGTYIRTLVEDIGAQLGCGAHVSALQRTRAGGFDIERAYTIDELAVADLDSLLLPVKCLLDTLPQLSLNAADSNYVTNGRAVMAPLGILPGDFCLINESEQLLGVGTALNDGRLVPKRMCSSIASYS